MNINAYYHVDDKISISIEGTDAEEIIITLARFGVTVRAGELGTAKAAAVADVVSETVVAKKAKKEKLPVAEAAVEVPVVTEPVQESATEQKTVTVDEVRKALQEFVAKTDYATGMALVNSFGATRITEINPEQYGEFVRRTYEVAA